MRVEGQRMKPVDLRRSRAGSMPAGRRRLERFTVGSSVGMIVRIGDAVVLTNGHVTAVEADATWAELPHVHSQHLLRRSAELTDFHDVGTGKKLRKGMLCREQLVELISSYPSGASSLLRGRVTGLIADAVQISGIWVAYGGRDFHGRPRALHVRTH